MIDLTCVSIGWYEGIMLILLALSFGLGWGLVGLLWGRAIESRKWRPGNDNANV